MRMRILACLGPVALVAGILLLASAAPARAGTLLVEPFDYPDGDLVGNGGWVAHSGSTTYPVRVIDGHISVVNGFGPRQDVHKDFPASGGSARTFAAFDLSVPSNFSDLLLGQFDYFAHFRSSTSFLYPARIQIGPPEADGDFRVGIAAGSTSYSTVVPWPADLSFDETYRIAVCYDAATGTAILWVNPTSVADPSVSSSGSQMIGDPVSSYAFRQSAHTRIELDIDNLAVGTRFDDVLNPFNRAPDCSEARAMIPAIWPPDHRMAAVAIAGVTDPDGDPVTITATGIAQDEPVEGRGDGATCPDGEIDATGRAHVRMERSAAGGANGRVYVVSFTATDDKGASCAGAVTVCVPHDQGSNPPCVDDGVRYNSLGACHRIYDLHPEDADAPELHVLGTGGRQVLLEFAVPGERQPLDLSVFDVAGRRLTTLVHGPEWAGRRQVVWNARSAGAGVYFVRLRLASAVVTRTVIVRE